MQPTTNTAALILPQYQPHLPGEMPHAYLVRTGDHDHDYDRHEVMYNDMVVDQLGCITRRDAANKVRQRMDRIELANIPLGRTGLDINVVAFYSRNWETIRPSQFDWSERDVARVDVEAVFDASTWEDVTELVDHELLEERILKND